VSVFDTWLDYVAKTPHVVLAYDLEKADTSLDEERAARLKAEAERDDAWPKFDEAMTALHLAAAGRDEALALLSKAREALRVADENLCGGCEPELADLTKILGTGETT